MVGDGTVTFGVESGPAWVLRYLKFSTSMPPAGRVMRSTTSTVSGACFSPPFFVFSPCRMARPDREIGHDSADSVDEVDMEALAPEFAVGDGLYADCLLLLHHLRNGGVFAPAKFVRAQRLVLPLLARFSSDSGAQQAADMVGAKRCFHRNSFLAAMLQGRSAGRRNGPARPRRSGLRRAGRPSIGDYKDYLTFCLPIPISLA